MATDRSTADINKTGLSKKERQEKRRRGRRLRGGGTKHECSERKRTREKGVGRQGKGERCKGRRTKGGVEGRGRGVNNFSIIKIIVIIGRYVLKMKGREGRERGNFVVFQNIKKGPNNTR